MCYGSAELAKEKLCRYLGSDPLKENVTTGEVELEMPSSGLLRHRFNHQRIGMVAMMQRDADILYLWHKVIFKTFMPCVVCATRVPHLGSHVKLCK